MRSRDSKRIEAVTGFGLKRRCVIAAAIAALALLPIEAAHAGWFSDLFRSKKETVSRKSARPAKPAAALESRDVKRSEPKPDNSKTSSNVSAAKCDASKFRIVVDVGHTADSEGAMSSRNVAEFVFNLRLAKRIEEKLKAEGFRETKLLVTEGKARRSLVKRVASASRLNANLFLSIHHDSVPTKFLEEWEFEGNKRHFSDRFSGYSVFVSRRNPDFKTSLAFAELLGKQMKAHGLEYAKQYSQPIMGRYQHPLLNRETGVYSYDELIVLRKTRMPAVLLEAGSIINRNEELKMDSPEHRDIVGDSVAAAAKKFCDAR